MDTAIATTKFVRTSPRKLRLVADTIRGMELQSALTRLQFLPHRAAKPIAKTLKQAQANARQKNLLPPYRILTLTIDKGPIYKRWQPVSRGRAHSIRKPAAHIKVIVTSQPAKISLPSSQETPPSKTTASPSSKKTPTPKPRKASLSTAKQTKATKEAPTKRPAQKIAPIIKPRTTSK